MSPRTFQCSVCWNGETPLSGVKPCSRLSARSSAHLFLDRLICDAAIATSLVWACVTSSIRMADVGHFLELLFRMESAFPWLSVMRGTCRCMFPGGETAIRCWNRQRVPRSSKLAILRCGVGLSKSHGVLACVKSSLNHHTSDFNGKSLSVNQPPMDASVSLAEASEAPHHLEYGANGETWRYGFDKIVMKTAARCLTRMPGLPDVWTAWNHSHHG